MEQQILTLLFSALMCSVNARLEGPSLQLPARSPVQRSPEFVHVTLDRNTAHRRLLVSENNRTATLVRETQPYPDHPERYQRYHQILGSADLRGRCYFEVEWKDWVDIAMTYKLNHFGKYSQAVFGDDSYSWSLRIYDGHFYVCHGNVQEPIRRISTGLVGFSAGNVGVGSAGFISGVVGIYLDYEEGILSFYEILDEGRASHLHTFREKFTQPLFPGFGVWIVFAQRSVGNSVSLVTPRLSQKMMPAWKRAKEPEPVPEEFFEPAPLQLFSISSVLILLLFMCAFSVFPWHLIF
ncbi:stonustoxin subunit alpha-like [Periophthalmus magnuspinnatus]|uniref:stonustoxin subunit alpha-like n=1 Tax=Periophthalmus magnuspinnatus TaxID=409849 RepID=UPI00243648DF|nr:stonustoxin subunit alpha-like [Periophthalmus magnuspinnatus]